MASSAPVPTSAGDDEYSRGDLYHRRRFTNVTGDVDALIQRRAEVRCGDYAGAIPYSERWRSCVSFSDSVLKCNRAVTDMDVMVTLCVKGQPAVNIIVDTVYNTLESLHAKLAERFGDEFGSFQEETRTFVPPLETYKYTCKINVYKGGELTQELRRLQPGQFLDWLLNGHIIEVEK